MRSGLLDDRGRVARSLDGDRVGLLQLCQRLGALTAGGDAGSGHRHGKEQRARSSRRLALWRRCNSSRQEEANAALPEVRPLVERMVEERARSWRWERSSRRSRR